MLRAMVRSMFAIARLSFPVDRPGSGTMAVPDGPVTRRRPPPVLSIVPPAALTASASFRAEEDRQPVLMVGTTTGWALAQPTTKLRLPERCADCAQLSGSPTAG